MIPLLTLHLATLAVGAHTAGAATLEDAWSEAETHASELVIVKEQRVQTDQATTSAWAMLSPKLTRAAVERAMGGYLRDDDI